MAVAVLLLVLSLPGLSQELTPRVYWPAPNGTSVAVVGYSHTSGDVLFDPSIPLYGVDSSLDSYVFAFLQTFSLFNRTSTLLIEVPYSDGTTSGFIGTTPASGHYSGGGDLGISMAINLYGAPSMTVEQFGELRLDPRPILGASLKLVAPNGKYDPKRLLNTGTNRWALKPEIGFTYPLSTRWFLEMRGSAWFFGDDVKFIGGYKKQDPIYSASIHLIRRFEPGLWASLDANYFTGGRQTIDGVRLGDVQRNSKIGATVAIPLKGRHAIKLGYSTGLVTEYGTDFDQFLFSYVVVIN